MRVPGTVGLGFSLETFFLGFQPQCCLPRPSFPSSPCPHAPFPAALLPQSFGRLAQQSAAPCLAWKSCQSCPITMLLSSGSPAQSIPLQQPHNMPSRQDSALRPHARVRARTGARTQTSLLHCWSRWQLSSAGGGKERGGTQGTSRV